MATDWLGLAGLGVSALGTLGGLFSSDGDAEAMNRKQRQMMDWTMNMGNKRWEEYEATYAPLGRELASYYGRGMGQAISEISAPAIEDINKAFLAAQRQLNLNAAQTGAAGGGAHLGGMTNLAGGAAEAKARTMTGARTQAKNEKLAGMMSLYQIAQGQPANALQGYGIAGNMAGNAAQLYNKMAGQEASAWGQLAGTGLRVADYFSKPKSGYEAGEFEPSYGYGMGTSGDNPFDLGFDINEDLWS